MIVDLKPYPERKNSDVPWLGEIPSKWRIVRNGSLFTQRNQTGFAHLPIMEVSLNTGVRLRDFEDSKHKQVMSDFSKYKRAAKGDLAYNMMRMWQGAVGVAPVDGLVSPAYVVVRPNENVVSPYYAYLFRTDAYMNEVDAFSRGIVKDRNRLYWDQFKQIPSPYPPPDEQAAIVRFLDHANGRIERAIRAKRKLIALLNEQKQAIIHRAVTRGLDPTVPLKPSGVPWLGDIPKHWEKVTLGRICTVRCDGPFGSGLKSMHYVDSGVRVIRLQNIGSARFRDRVSAFISHQHYATLGDHSVIAGDLLVAGLGDEKIPAGRACLAPAGIEPAMVKADCFRFRLKPGRVVPEFLALNLSATAAGATACLSSGSTRLRINLSATAARSIAFPPTPEQKMIVAKLESECAPLYTALARTEREIGLLREYRTRLIADVVTGKLDVREAARQLPEAPAEPEITPDAEDLLESETVEAEA